VTQFTPDESERYRRQIVLPEVGEEGQAKLGHARVLVVGAGGLGSPVALYLAAAGVGTIGIVDHDVVQRSNLQRQVLYADADVGKKKAEVAAKRLLAMNPGIKVTAYGFKCDALTAMQLMRGFDLVADCTDNFPSRYLVNDAAVLSGKPVVCGSLYRFEGQVSVFGLVGGPCYRCAYPVPPSAEIAPNCTEAGILGSLAGIVGSIQATEILKLILAAPTSLAGRVMLFDGWSATSQEIIVRRNPACPHCGDHPTIHTLTEVEESCAENSEGDAMENADVTVQELKKRMDAGEHLHLVDVRERWEYAICNLGGDLVPLRELESRASELRREQEIIVYCHHGVRSASAVALLRHLGFPRVRNLAGGIDAWARAIDRSMQRY
jgi:sulfur-carrier protein adenylyltransferase/sulfurtransferase